MNVPLKALPCVGRDSTQEDIVWENVDLLEPHSILAYLLDAGLDIPQERVREYWTFARDLEQPWATFSPASQDHIPVGVWGDSATVYTEFGRYKILAIFMSLPLWRPKSVRYSRFLLFTMESDRLLDHRSLLPIWRRIVWSLNCSFNGTWPACGPQGERLTGGQASRNAGKPLCASGAKFCCTEIRGDWAWLKETFRFPACAWNALKVCYRCPARSDSLMHYYRHDGSGNYWLGKEFSLVQFLNQRMPATDPCAWS